MASGIPTTVRTARRPSAEQRERADWHRRATVLYEELRLPAARLVRRGYGGTFGDTELEDIYSGAWVGTLRALERRAHRMSDDDIRSYVLTAVANQANKELRRRRRKPVAPIDAVAEVAEDEPTPEDSLTRRETREVTRDLLSSLPPRRRAVMLLRYGWGLDPAEVCRMVDGLSPRAYRKEVTKGVDQLAARVRLHEQGRWCQDREPVLKAYAAGVADADEALQARNHMAHCRSCSEFVGKLTGHLHDLGSSVLLPGALDAADGHVGLLDRLRDGAEGARESVLGVLGRSDPAEAAAITIGSRSAGAAGAGVAAKLSALGAGGKAALACLGGTVAATACVATGIGPIGGDGAGGNGSGRGDAAPSVATGPVDPIEHMPGAHSAAATIGDGNDGAGEQANQAAEPPPVTRQPAPTLAPSTPPQTAEFGVESAAAPTGGAPSGGAGAGSGGGAVAKEFGP